VVNLSILLAFQFLTIITHLHKNPPGKVVQRKNPPLAVTATSSLARLHTPSTGFLVKSAGQGCACATQALARLQLPPGVFLCGGFQGCDYFTGIYFKTDATQAQNQTGQDLRRKPNVLLVVIILRPGNVFKVPSITTDRLAQNQKRVKSSARV